MIDETYRFEQNDIQSSRGTAWLSYLWILFLVPMLTNPNSPYTKFHINQGIIFFIVSALLNVVAKIFRFIPFIGWIFPLAVGLLTFAFAAIGIINVLQGRAVRLPIIGNVEIYR